MNVFIRNQKCMIGTADGSQSFLAQPQVLSFGGLTDNNTENLAMDLCLECNASCMLKTLLLIWKKCRRCLFFCPYQILHNCQWQSKVYVLGCSVCYSYLYIIDLDLVMNIYEIFITGSWATNQSIFYLWHQHATYL